jgi:hypothetical protein
MKKLLTISALMLASWGAFSQEYAAKLGEAFMTFNTTKDHQEKINQSNKLGLIAKKYSQDWVTGYYAALSKIFLSYEEQDNAKKDAYLDDADLLVAQAVAAAGQMNDELHVLQAMAANARLAVDPAKRWQKYGKIFEENLEKAKALNPENPRIYYIKGTSLFYTPKMWGGGKEKALEYFKKAEVFFEKEAKGDIAKPFWGKEANDYFMGECQKAD